MANDATYTSNEKNLMAQISSNCQALSNLSDGDVSPNDKRQYADSKRWLNRDLSLLQKTIPIPQKSNFIIWDIPFSKRLQDCEQKISAANQMISKLPSSKAENYLGSALFFCKAIRKNPTRVHSFKDSYGSHKIKAVQAYKPYQQNDDLRSCDTDIEILVSKIKNQIELQTAERIEAEKQRKDAVDSQAQRETDLINQQQKRIKEKRDQQNQIAKNLGYQGIYTDMSDVIYSLNNGDLDLDHLTKFLIHIKEYDEYRLSSVSGDYAIYNNGYDTTEFIQFSVLKQNNMFYGKDALLKQGLYRVEGVDTFSNSLGQQSQLLVLKWEKGI